MMMKNAKVGSAETDFTNAETDNQDEMRQIQENAVRASMKRLNEVNYDDLDFID